MDPARQALLKEWIANAERVLAVPNPPSQQTAGLRAQFHKRLDGWKQELGQ